MKKILLAATLMTTVLASCNNDAETASEVAAAQEMQVNAFVADELTSRAGWTGDKKSFQTSDAIGLYVYQGKWGTSYNSVKANVKSVYTQGVGWTQTPTVNLTSNKAQVWAYYPYSEAATDGSKLAVDLTKDYLYGTNGAADINTAKPIVNIQMKHALTQFVLRLKKSPEYKDKGILSQIKLRSTTNEFSKNGTLDVQNGNITGAAAANFIEYASLSEKFPTGETAVDYAALLFPMNTKNVTLEVMIDGVKYEYKIPATQWEAGKKNVYSVALNSNSIIIGGNDGSGITIEPWGKGADQSVTLKPIQ